MKSTYWNNTVWLLLLSAIWPSSAASQTIEWVRQLGTSSRDISTGVSADGLGNVYIAGYTEGSLDGLNHGDADAFVSKYSAAGVLEWTRQLGTNSLDYSQGVSADGLGNVYISGQTVGGLDGPNRGHYDAFVSKYSAEGVLEWTRQLGTSSYEYNSGVSADGLGNIYISGQTNGSVDGSNHGSYDAYVSKYTAEGVLEWTRQLGTSGFESGLGVSADGLGNVVISGHTTGSLDGSNQGGPDAYVSKYNADGALLWTRQLGTSAFEYAAGVSADAMGNVYTTGHTYGSLEGANKGLTDAFVSMYTAAGTLAWTRQLGTSSFDESHKVSADGLGNVYISGHTLGSLAGSSHGFFDAFVARISVIPEPSSQMLLVIGMVLTRRRGR